MNIPIKNQPAIISTPQDVLHQSEKSGQFPVTRKTALEDCQIYSLTCNVTVDALPHCDRLEISNTNALILEYMTIHSEYELPGGGGS